MNNKQITYISIEQLTHHPNNPRKDLGDLTELIDSIKQKGILQNLTVVPWYPVDEENYQKWLSATKAERETITNEEGYFVLIGNRRFEAAKSAGLTELPCIIAEVPREEQMEIMLLENMQRSDLTVYEEAEGFQMMLDLGYSADEIANKTGFARSTVYKRVDLLKLDKTGFKASVDRGATLAELIKLNKIEDEEERNNVLNKAGTKDFEYELERALRRQGNKKYLQSVVDVLKPFAKELTEDEKRRRCQYNSEGTRDLEQVAYWSTYRHTDDVTLPELEEDEEYFYYVDSGYSVTLYGPIKEEEEPDEPSEESIKREEKSKARNKLIEIWDGISKVRKEYILNMTEKDWSQCLKGFLKSIMVESENNSWIDYDSFINILESPTTYDEETESQIVDVAAGVDKMLESGINRSIGLFLIAGHTDLIENYNNNTPFVRYFSNSEIYRGNDDDVIFESTILAELGYEPSEEEQKILDGTHELYKLWEEDDD